MPDGSGRHLAQYLKDNSLEYGPPQGSKSRGKARRWDAREAAQNGNGADPDVALLYKVGREKRRRWLADTLLRKMAGRCTPAHYPMLTFLSFRHVYILAESKVFTVPVNLGPADTRCSCIAMSRYHEWKDVMIARTCRHAECRADGGAVLAGALRGGAHHSVGAH